VDTLIKKIEFHEQKAKELKARAYKELSDKEGKKFKVISQEVSDEWAMYHGDCIPVLKNIPNDSIHYSIFSPPFASLYTYSNSLCDMGNSTDDEFYSHFGFLIPELYRVIMPGRLVSFHCMNLLMTIGADGVIGLKAFRGNLIKAFVDHGFIYHSEVVVWKDPLVQAVRTRVLSLAHKQISKDSTRCGMGTPDYIVTVRKPGNNPEPVFHGRGFEEYIGEREEPHFKKDDNHLKNKYSHHVWQRYASPVWFDIRQTNTLNVNLARDKNDERHICPLQLDVIARCLELWTNPGDIVLSPFAGIGSEGYEAVKRKRKFIGIELKKSYYDISVQNLRKASKNKIKTLGLDNGNGQEEKFEKIISRNRKRIGGK